MWTEFTPIYSVFQCMCVFVYFMHSFTYGYWITVSTYIELFVVLIMDALKSVFFWASLAHFEETGAPVWGERQLLQHNVLWHVNFLAKIHLYVWTEGDMQNNEWLEYTIYTWELIDFRLEILIFPISHNPTYQTSLNIYYIHAGKKKNRKLLQQKPSTWTAELAILPIWWTSNYLLSYSTHVHV